VATIFALKPSISLMGTLHRREGLIHLTSYYLLFLLSKNIKNKKYVINIIHTILIMGIFNMVYGICQTVPILSKLSNVVSPWMYARGTFGNSNFYGTYMLIELTLALGLYFYKSNKYLIFVFIYTFCLILSGCMGSILSFIIICICLFLIKIIKKEDYKKIFFTFLSLIISIFIITNTTKSEIIKDLNVFKSEINETITTGLKDEYGTNRIYIWNRTLNEVPKHILTGVGIDNFEYAFNPRIVTFDEFLVVDKAHNEYLQKLFTEGIFSMITYIVLLLTILIYGIKNVRKNLIYMPLLLLFIGYSIQAFFNISVIDIAPLFFIFSGLLVYDEKRNK